MAFEDYHASRTTLERLESNFKNGYLTVLKLIADSPDFFNGSLTGEELFTEFVENPLEEIKDQYKKKNKKNGDGDDDEDDDTKELKMSDKYVLNRNKCHAIIHLKKELRQCQSNPTPDDYFCNHHSKLDVLPYGRVYFDN
jgi:hypothetical protein